MLSYKYITGEYFIIDITKSIKIITKKIFRTTTCTLWGNLIVYLFSFPFMNGCILSTKITPIIPHAIENARLILPWKLNGSPV